MATAYYDEVLERWRCNTCDKLCEDCECEDDADTVSREVIPVKSTSTTIREH